jgi:hypothetical protein
MPYTDAALELLTAQSAIITNVSPGVDNGAIHACDQHKRGSRLAQTDIWAGAFVIDHAEQRCGESRTEFHSASCPCNAPVGEVAAHDLPAGDVVRLDDPQAHRVERVALFDGRVVVELRPVRLDDPDAVREPGDASRGCARADVRPAQLMTELAKEKNSGRTRHLLSFVADRHYHAGTRAR